MAASADQSSDAANEERVAQRMRVAVQDRLALDDPEQRLDVHHDLRAAKNHEAEVPAANRLEQCPGAKVDGSKRHWVRPVHS